MHRIAKASDHHEVGVLKRNLLGALNDKLIQMTFRELQVFFFWKLNEVGGFGRTLIIDDMLAMFCKVKGDERLQSLASKATGAIGFTEGI